MDVQTMELMRNYLTGFPKQFFFSLLVFFLPLRKKEKWYLYLPVPLLLLAGLIELGMLLIPRIPWNEVIGPVYFSLHYCMVFVIYGISVRLMTGASVKEIGYCLVCAYMAEHMLYCWTNIGAYLLKNPPWWNEWYIQWIIGLVVYLSVYFGFSRRICRDGHYPFSALRSLSLFVFTMAVMFFLSILLQNMHLEWLHGIYTLLLCTILMMEEANSAEQLRLEEEARSRERMESAYKAQYEMSKENIALINRKSHDLRRQVAALRTVGTPEERADAIAEIEQAVDVYDRTFQTGNRALDTALMQAALKCSQNSIELSVIADGSLLRFIRSVDLYTMLSNILDNAVEANLRITDQEKRSIHLSVHERKGLVILQCENPYEGEITMKDGLPLTVKADKANHGFGTGSISAAAASYGGTLRINPRDGMYILRIIFQPPDANQDKKTTSQDKAV